VNKWIQFKEQPLRFLKDIMLKPKRVEMNYSSLSPYTHLLYTGENITGFNHLNLWIPHFIEANIDFLVFVRNLKLFHFLKKEYPHITVLFAKSQTELDVYLQQLPFLKACFYPSNTGKNLHLLHFNHLKHIFIGHGDSDKTASVHKYFRVYDENWTAGEAHIDRFRNAGFNFLGLENIRVGRPNLKEILELSEVAWQERFEGKINLLYLSTWEGVVFEHDYTSVSMINTAFNNIYTTFDEINIKLHPWIGRRESNLLNTSKVLEKSLKEKNIKFSIASKDTNINILIKKSNIFICDISAVVTDCLAANAPIFVYIPKNKGIKLSKSKMGYEDYTYVFSTVDELVTKIDTVLGGNDYLREKREEAMQYILGKEETLQNQFTKQLINIKN